jgi:hypothetical protein
MLPPLGSAAYGTTRTPVGLLRRGTTNCVTLCAGRVAAAMLMLPKRRAAAVPVRPAAIHRTRRDRAPTSR